MGQITDFVVRHQLEVSGTNLKAICNALSGASPTLAEQIAAREHSGQPIDQQWLEGAIRLDPETGSKMGELEELMDRLEDSLAKFAHTAKSAQDETSGHRGAIDAQISELAAIDISSDATAGMDRVISLSRSMLERIEAAEKAMESSREETDKLRENLAKARLEADVDHLTGLPNRRAFERKLSSISDRARANDQPLCVAFCDVDHFKTINDRNGHDTGDRVLCAIAGIFKEFVSDDCFVARHGGEEFSMLFYGLDKDASWRRLDGIRRKLAAKKMMNRETGRPIGRVSFSGGIAEVTENLDTRSALVRADAALYEAKAAGRNQIITI